MKTKAITCVWKSYHDIEVPDDFNVEKASLSDFPDEALEEMNALTAELVDWY